MWYAKMYFSGEKEFFENDAFGMQGLPSKQLELPFLESLLTFLELDEKEITPMLERISVNWEHFVESSDLGAHTAKPYRTNRDRHPSSESCRKSVSPTDTPMHPLAVSCHYFIAHSCLVLLLTLTLPGLLAALD